MARHVVLVTDRSAAGTQKADVPVPTQASQYTFCQKKEACVIRFRISV